jgi:hypothetical protein
MAVVEVREVLSDDERVKQLLVDDDEVVDRAILPGVVNRELQRGRARRLRRRRHARQVEMKLHRVRDVGAKRHPAAAAVPRRVRTDVGIHRAHVDCVLPHVEGCRHTR